ncbi:IS256 family transposase, variant Zn-binding type, partial [Arcobacter vandammei]|uniref:IS256 family transposase, variant Zn-binding type n=1 Tax=Arcobacter vandammei TaxID=2782243 RepID=UPI003B8480C0
MCPNCKSFCVKKNGKRREIQRYLCADCGHSFSSSKRPNKLIKKLFFEYFQGKQTLKQLSIKYHKSIPWIKKYLDEYEPDEIKISPSKVIIVADATFFGKRKDKMGTLVFKDVINNKIIVSKHIQSETVEDYKQLFKTIKEQGYEVLGVVLDGKRGLNKAFKDIPIQLCHFHQIAIVKRYLTNNPRLDASIDLLQITKKLPNIKKESFEEALNIWYIKYKSFLEEQSLNPNTLKYSPTHP